MSKKYKKDKLTVEEWGLAAGCLVVSFGISAIFDLSGGLTSCIFVTLYIFLFCSLKNAKEKKEQELLNKQMEIRKRYLEEQKRIEAEKKTLLEKEKKKKADKPIQKEIKEESSNKVVRSEKKTETIKEIPNQFLPNSTQKIKYPYIIDYLNEDKFKKLERSIKKYNMLAYKKLFFDYYPSLKEGKFLGKLVSTNSKDQTFNYELELPTDEMFKKIHGTFILHYTVYVNQKIILLNTITPEDLLTEGHKAELLQYKGVMVSKSNREKDMFKINLLNMLDKK